MLDSVRFYISCSEIIIQYFLLTNVIMFIVNLKLDFASILK